MSADEVLEAVRGIVGGALQGLVDGAAEDVEQLAAELAQDLTRAAAAQDEELLDLTRARLQLLAERTRVWATDAAWETVADIVAKVFEIAKEALAA